MQPSSDHRFAGGEKGGPDGGFLRHTRPWLSRGRRASCSPPLTLFHLSFVQTADDQPCDKGRPGICPLCAWTRPLFCGMSGAGGLVPLPSAPPPPNLGWLCPPALCPPLPTLPAGPASSFEAAELAGTGLNLPRTLAGLIVTGWVGGTRQELGRASESSLLIHRDPDSEGLGWVLLAQNLLGPGKVT